MLLDLLSDSEEDLVKTIQSFEIKLCALDDTDIRIKRTIEFARNHLDSPLSLSQLAASGCVSRWHLCRLFRTTLGVPPVQFVRLLRLRSASILLERTRLSVKEVMAAVGINDQSHFVRDFEKYFSQSPLKYRTGRRAAREERMSMKRANFGQ
jgi:transcriptional regulator GlxA family with amidase domain